MENNDFDYKAAVSRLEEIAAKIEDPTTALDDMETLIKESDALVTGCRGYLRAVREKVENLDK